MAQRLNAAQRVVISIALGVALFLIGQWIVGGNALGSTNFGWVAYAPLGTSAFRRTVLHPWVVLVIYLVLTALWTALSLALFRKRPIASESHEIVEKPS